MVNKKSRKVSTVVDKQANLTQARDSVEEEEENLSEFLVLFDPNATVQLSVNPSSVSSSSGSPHPSLTQTRSAVTLQSLRRKRELEFAQQPESPLQSHHIKKTSKSPTRGDIASASASASTMVPAEKRMRYSQGDSLVSSSSSSSSDPQQQQQQQQQQIQQHQLLALCQEEKEVKREEPLMTLSSSSLTTADTGLLSSLPPPAPVHSSPLPLPLPVANGGGGGKKWTEKAVEQVSLLVRRQVAFSQTVGRYCINGG